MPQPKAVEDLTRELLALYQRAWERISQQEQALLEHWVGYRRAERLARLRDLRVTVEGLMDSADRQALTFVTNSLPSAYAMGAAAAGVGAAFTLVDPDAVSLLADDTYSSLLAATRFVRASTKDLIRTLAREHVGLKLVTGQTAQQAGRELATALHGRGIAAVVYKDGSRHGLAEYGDVVVRTKTAEAYSTATLNSLDRAGVTFAECFDNPVCGLDGHDDPVKPNGGVFELRVAQSAVISHPRCVRSWGGRPDVKSLREARSASGTASAAQNADQLATAVARQEAAIERAFRRRTAASVDRRAAALLSDEGSRVRSVAHARARARHELLRARARRAAG